MGGVFVDIGQGIDALCSISELFEVELGSKVSFRITVVREEEKRVRGNIMSLLR